MPVTTRDTIIGEAKNLPDLIAKAETADPALARQLTGKSLFAAKSPPFIVIASVLAWASSKWGLGWDESVVDTITLCVGVIAAYVMRYVTDTPITSILKAPPSDPTTGDAK